MCTDPVSSQRWHFTSLLNLVEYWVRKIPLEQEMEKFQDSYLKNPMDRGAWWATVHGVAKSRTRLRTKRKHTHPPTPKRNMSRNVTCSLWPQWLGSKCAYFSFSSVHHVCCISTLRIKMKALEDIWEMAYLYQPESLNDWIDHNHSILCYTILDQRFPHCTRGKKYTIQC